VMPKNKEDNLKPFNKGVSGNPNGRPKGSRNRATIVKYWLEIEEDADNPLTEQIEKLSQEDLITLSVIKKAREGDVNAYKALMDSAYGNPTQQNDHNVKVTGIKPIEWVKTKDVED
jgi:hypothetical protein